MNRVENRTKIRFFLHVITSPALYCSTTLIVLLFASRTCTGILVCRTPNSLHPFRTRNKAMDLRVLFCSGCCLFYTSDCLSAFLRDGLFYAQKRTHRHQPDLHDFVFCFGFGQNQNKTFFYFCNGILTCQNKKFLFLF